MSAIWKGYSGFNTEIGLQGQGGGQGGVRSGCGCTGRMRPWWAGLEVMVPETRVQTVGVASERL